MIISSLTVNDLKADDITRNDVKAIRLVEKDGEIYTFDHRRLKAFQEAGKTINYRKVDYKSLNKFQKNKFNSTTEGKTIKIREQKNE